MLHVIVCVACVVCACVVRVVCACVEKQKFEYAMYEVQSTQYTSYQVYNCICVCVIKYQ